MHISFGILNLLITMGVFLIPIGVLIFVVYAINKILQKLSDIIGLNENMLRQLEEINQKLDKK